MSLVGRREEAGGVVEGREGAGSVVDGREEEIGEGVEAEPEGLTLCSPLGNDRGEALPSLDPLLLSQEPSHPLPSPSQVACTRCGMVVYKKSIRAHERSNKCARQTVERVSASFLGKRPVEGGRQSPQGEKRPHFVPLAPGSPASGGGGNGSGMTLRPRR